MSVFYIKVVLAAVTSQTKSVNLLHGVLKEPPSSLGGGGGGGNLEMPGEEVCNLIVLKEKSIFRIGRPRSVGLIRKWTEALQKRIIAVH